MAESRSMSWNPVEDVCAGCGQRTAPPRIACANCGCIRADRSGAYYLAPRLRRLAAYIMDIAALGIVGFVASALLGDWVDSDEGAPMLETTELDGLLSGIIALAVAVALWSFTLRRGQSPGMRLMNVHVRRLEGAIPAPGRFLVRDLWPIAVGLAISLIALLTSDAANSTLGWVTYAVFAVQLVSAAWVLWERDRRALHDMVFDTVVVEERRRPLYDRLGRTPDQTGD